MKVLVFILCLALFVGGLVVMAYAFTPEGFDAPIFIGGILASSLAVFVPMSVLRWLDRA